MKTYDVKEAIMSVQWKEGLRGTYTARLGVFIIRIQPDDDGQWKSDMHGLVAKPRWTSLDEAKTGAVRAWSAMFSEAAREGGVR